EVNVAGEHDVIRAHASGRRRDALADPGGVDLPRAGLFDNLRARLFRCRRQAEGIVQRMTMESAREVETLEVGRAMASPSPLLGRPRFDLGAERVRDQLGLRQPPLLAVEPLHREPAVDRAHTGHRGLADGAADVVDAARGEDPQFPGALQPDPLDDALDALGKAGTAKTGVPPGRFPGAAPPPQDRHGPATPGELTRDGEAGKPAADDADIDVEVVNESIALWSRHPGCAIPGGAVNR